MSILADGSYRLDPFSCLPLDVQIMIFEYCVPSKATILAWRAVNTSSRTSSRSLPLRWYATPALTDEDLETFLGHFPGLVFLDASRCRGGFNWGEPLSKAHKLRSLFLPLLCENVLALILEQRLPHLIALQFDDGDIKSTPRLPSLIGSRVQLQRLSVRRDMITPMLSCLTNLNYLRLVGHTPISGLSSLSFLTHLVLHPDPDATVPHTRDCSPSDLSSLNRLELLECRSVVSFSTFLDITSYLSNLSVLCLPSLRLPDLQSEVGAHAHISRLTRLRILDVPFVIRRSTAQYLALQPFLSLQRLETLQLVVESEDFDLTPLRSLPNIRSLSIQHPKLTACLKVIFSFSQLCDLELRSGSLRASGWHLLSRLHSLQTFRLVALAAEELPNSITLISKLSRLNSLSLDGLIRILPPLSSPCLTKLEVRSSLLQVGSFSALPQLRQLSLLPSNDLSPACEFPELQGIPTTLVSLQLSSVSSRTVFDSLLSCSLLRKLELSAHLEDPQMEQLVEHLPRLNSLTLRLHSPLSEQSILRLSSLRGLHYLRVMGIPRQINVEHVHTKLILSLPSADVLLAYNQPPTTLLEPPLNVAQAEELEEDGLADGVPLVPGGGAGGGVAGGGGGGLGAGGGGGGGGVGMGGTVVEEEV